LSDNELDFIVKVRDLFYNLTLAYKNLDLEKTKNFLEERENMSYKTLEILNEKTP
jgi:hypothetical protein